jgi:hypothetical protein
VSSLVRGFLQGSKVVLEIEKPQFVKKSFHHIEGHQLRVSVRNKGRISCLNLCAKFDIKDSEGKAPGLLNVRVDVTDGNKVITATEEPMKPIKYAWVDKDERVLKVLQELKKDDAFGLLFPYETFFAGVGSSTASSEYLLKLQVNTDYEVEIEVEGEGSDKNAVMKRKRFHMRI